ncbi:MAG TPA: hypothetical protein VN714_34070 [Trebonia sp.]|nr:hypothetical protein [Trebonia sp.]
MSLAAVRDDLAAALEETLRLARRLAEDAKNTDVPVAELVAQATLLERLDQRRDELIGQLRRTASAGLRAAQPGPLIREVVLGALDELGWPQNARFLEEYLWAKHQLQLDSRAFASLRRDELRAWRRSPGARSAYVVPALNPDGSANPRWLTSSAWDLSRRVVASAETERLFDLQKIIVLNVRGSRGPLGTLLERSVAGILAIEPPPVSASITATRAWRTHVRSHAAALVAGIRSSDDANREQIAAGLASLPDHDRVWGTQGAAATEGRAPEN